MVESDLFFGGFLPSLSSDYLVNLSLWVIIFCAVIIIVLIVFIFVFLNRSATRKKTKEVLSSLDAIKKGEIPSLNHKIGASNSPVYDKRIEEAKEKLREAVKSGGMEVKKKGLNGDVSLKALLIKKFKPKIEVQLGTKVNIIDFSFKGEEFFALTEVSGIKVMLSLDSAGKIFDYKKIKEENNKPA